MWTNKQVQIENQKNSSRLRNMKTQKYAQTEMKTQKYAQTEKHESTKTCTD